MKKRPYLFFLSDTTGYRVGNIVQGILQECHRAKVGLLWREHDNFQLQALGHMPLGAVVWGKMNSIEPLLRSIGDRFPVVSTISHTLERPFYTVVPDPVDVARQAAGHLVGEGLRNFIFVGSRRNLAAQLRHAAFQAEILRRGLEAKVHFFNVELADRFWGADSERGQAFVRFLRRTSLPVGVFAFNDQTAASCLECAEMAEIRVPHEMAIVGVDDHPIFSRMIMPLSTVKIDYTEIGRVAANLLLKPRPGRAGAKESFHRFVGGQLIVRQSSRLRLLSDSRLARALEYVHENYQLPLSLPDLAKRAGMSRASFAHHFQRAAGESPIRYLVHLRLAQAKLMLAESVQTVSEISHHVGFTDQGYFTRAFKREIRLTPTEYRRRHMLRRLTV